MTRGETTSGCKTTRGKRPGGNVLGAKRLGEEMVLGRNDQDSLRANCLVPRCRAYSSAKLETSTTPKKCQNLC